LSLSALATASAWLGDPGAAQAAIRSMDALGDHPYARAEQEHGRAWALVATGELAAARDVLRQAAEMGRSSGFRTTEALMLHDVARLGEPGSVAGQLADLAAACEGELVQAYAVHARAAADRDPDGLVEATDRFERIGALLLAAEAATEAAQALQSAGDRRSSTAMGARASTLLASCEGARTPALNVPVMVAPLTARERDVATLAARGVPSKEIAERLVLSVRTVNNHLQSAYSKLGVSGRRQLAAALAGNTDVEGG
jgi:DNA-binding NarL/FixJ family response regulator